MAAGSSSASDVRLKLLIDSKGKRVLFGEADKNLIDFLFNLLSLPLGTVIRLLKTQGMVGCLGNLYESVETLNDTYLQPNQTKDAILKPKVSFCCSAMLLPNVESSAATTATKFYMCSSRCGYNVANDPAALCPSCRYRMTQVCAVVDIPNASNNNNNKQATNNNNNGEGGYVKGVVTYMVMDDLSVKPMSTISSITLLNSFNIKEVGALEEKVITLDINQAVKLLRASLQSNTVLTDVFLDKKV